jgi:hypothetical protein
VWVDARKKTRALVQISGEAEVKDPCREKIGYFLQGGLSYRPDIDLNAWYILALNRKASITVIDPLLGYGGSPSSLGPRPMLCSMRSRSALIERTEDPTGRRRAHSRPCSNSTRSSACDPTCRGRFSPM